MKGDFRYSIIGLIISVVSFVSSFTFIVPMIVISPVAIHFENSHPNAPYSVIGPSAIHSLSILLIIVCFTYLFLLIVSRRMNWKMTLGLFITTILILTFVVHPLGFYLHVSPDWHQSRDGQFLMATAGGFPFSSFFYVVMGIITDTIHKNVQPSPKYLHKKPKDSVRFKDYKSVPHKIDQLHVEDFIKKYKGHSDERLKMIATEKGWQTEAKEAAKRLLAERKS